MTSTNEFFAALRGERDGAIAAAAAMQAEVERLTRERDEALALVTAMREAAAVLLDNDGGEGSSCYNAGRRYDAREALKEALSASGPVASAAMSAVGAKTLDAVADAWEEAPHGKAPRVAIFVTMLRETAARIRAEAQG